MPSLARCELLWAVLTVLNTNKSQAGLLNFYSKSLLLRGREWKEIEGKDKECRAQDEKSVHTCRSIYDEFPYGD